jgi:hypothetical protein
MRFFARQHICEVAASSPRLIEHLAAILTGKDLPFSALGAAPVEVLATCTEQGVTALVSLCVRTNGNWPQDLRQDLARHTRADAAKELLRSREVVFILDALARQGIRPILLKGTPLAYSVYDSPVCRPRIDTDLLVLREDVSTVRRILVNDRGYSAPVSSEGELLFRQLPLERTAEFGVDHALDIHWKISTQTLFAELLTYDELAAEAVSVPRLGPHARTAAPVHALLLACVHPVMHHRNDERLIWHYDIHLLMSRLRAPEVEQFVDLATVKGVSAICAHALVLTQARFGTLMPDHLIPRLAAIQQPEATAVYLRPGRRWHDELVSNVRGLTRWRDRMRLLYEVALPGRRYMLAAYGCRSQVLGSILLPVLHVHRLLWGVAKVLVGWK